MEQQKGICFCFYNLKQKFVEIDAMATLQPLKKNQEKFDILDSGFVKTCQEHVIYLEYSHGYDSKYKNLIIHSFIFS